VTDSRSPHLMRPPHRIESESPPELRDLLACGNKQSRPKNRGSMTIRLGGLGPSAYSVNPRMSVGLGLLEGPLKRTPFRRPYGIQWMRSLARSMNGCLSWRQPWGPSDGQGAVVAD